MTKKIIFEPTLDERKLDGYYFQRAECSNCRRAGITGDIDVMIPEGQLKPMKLFICPNCKCKTLEML